MTEYKPDWDSIPKEFKYCYYSVCGHSGKVEKKILSNCKMCPSVIGKMHLKRADRPPKLVDGAWYAVTLDDAVNSKLVVKWTESDGTFSLIGVAGIAYSLGRISIIHNRIPDELWKSN